MESCRTPPLALPAAPDENGSSTTAGHRASCGSSVPFYRMQRSCRTDALCNTLKGNHIEEVLVSPGEIVSQNDTWRMDTTSQIDVGLQRVRPRSFAP